MTMEIWLLGAVAYAYVGTVSFFRAYPESLSWWFLPIIFWIAFTVGLGWPLIALLWAWDWSITGVRALRRRSAR